MLWEYVCFVMKDAYDPYSMAKTDPYAILGIEHQDRNAANFTKVMKKAYRKLSLKYLSDYNRNDEAADRKFMQIAMAWDALTDDDARADFERYGHPHGPAWKRLWPCYDYCYTLVGYFPSHCKKQSLPHIFGVIVVAIIFQGVWLDVRDFVRQKDLSRSRLSRFRLTIAFVVASAIIAGIIFAVLRNSSSAFSCCIRRVFVCRFFLVTALVAVVESAVTTGRAMVRQPNFVPHWFGYIRFRFAEATKIGLTTILEWIASFEAKIVQRVSAVMDKLFTDREETDTDRKEYVWVEVSSKSE